MSWLDWLVVVVYLLGMLVLAVALGRTQKNTRDYYLGGNKLSSISLATSTIATQCSTNSLLGAPAFVGFVAGGGMLWLQYELAVPLAMLALMYLLVPLRQKGVVSVYEFLDIRLGRGARLLASGCFLFFRGVATGVTVYGVALVLTLLLDISYTTAVVVLMGVTIAYDVLGGLRAVVISDVVQMILIVVSVIASLFWLIGETSLFAPHVADRVTAIDLDLGLSSNNNYGLWPMLIGGFFLYCAYYGCDQSQAQRVLAARSDEETRRVLLYNGLLRFPVVLLYCLLGLGLANYAVEHDGLLGALPMQADGSPNFNLVFPVFVLQEFPAGLVGLVMAGILAAAMSSIDSALNSLSAATVEDFVGEFSASENPRKEFLAGKLATFCWGLFAVALSYQVEAIAPTVLEAINKIGSMANGPLLALFFLALVYPSVGQGRAIIGFGLGLVVNGLVWLFLPGISWLWWNLIGFAVGTSSALILTIFSGKGLVPDRLRYSPGLFSQAALLVMFCLILAVCLWFSRSSGI